MNVALDTIPETMWYVLGAIIGFYFTARELHKARGKKMALTSGQFQEPLQRQKSLDELNPVLPNYQYQKEMSDTSEALSLPSILEWNRRNKQKNQ